MSLSFRYLSFAQLPCQPLGQAIKAANEERVGLILRKEFPFFFVCHCVKMLLTIMLVCVYNER